jgi:TRAP-type mannitol/chloroaromatic compound transport system permease small subunit
MERPEEHVQPALTAHGGGPFVLPRNRFSNAIDSVIVRAGDAASWLWPILVVVVVLQVVLRYGFGQGSIMFEELQWHIYAVGFMIGLSYAADVDRHVRVDVIVERFSLRTRGWIELVGLAFFLVPFAIIVAYEGIAYAKSAWDFSEVSAAPGGLPYRWVLKSFITIAFVLLSLTAISRLTRCTTLLFGTPRPLSAEDAAKSRR